MKYRYLLIGIELDKFAPSMVELDSEGWELISTNTHKVNSNLININQNQKDILMLVLRIEFSLPETFIERSLRENNHGQFGGKK